MKRILRLFTLMSLVLAFSWTNASAVSLSFSNGVATLDFDGEGPEMIDQWGNITNEFNNSGWGSINNNNLTKLIIKGTVPTDNRDNIFGKIKEKFDQNNRTQTLDMSLMNGMTLDELKNTQLCAAKIILPKGMSLPDEDTYVASQSNGYNPKWASKGYICALDESGSTVTIAGQKFDNRNGESVIANDLGYDPSTQTIDQTQTVYPFSNATSIVLVPGIEGNGNDANYTSTDVSAIEKFNAASAVTTYENGVLTLAEGDDTLEALPGKVQELNASDADKVVFPDGSVWEKSTGKLTATANAEAHAAALEAAGFQVSSTSTVQKLGKYVSIVDGVTIFTVPNDNTTSVLGSNIDSNLLTDAEKEALKSATNLKLVGKITKDDWKALSDKAGSVPSGTTVNSLDLSAAIINDGSHGTDAFTLKDGDQFKNLTSLVLPNDPNYKIIPEGFATGTNITSITIPSQVETIGKGAFQGCTSLATLNFAEEGSLKTISESAFQRTNIGGNLVIPNSVEAIGDWAFGQCMEITALTINKGTNLWKGGIGNCAFEMNSEQGQGDNNNKLANVYINEDNPEHLIPCDAHAFGYDNTNGNTNVATVKTRLHYPPNLYSYYVGDWKIELNGGRLEGQRELDRLKTVVEQGSVTIQEDNKTVTATPYAHIGWQMFVSTGIPVTADTEWRTYSDIVPLLVPADAANDEDKVADVYIVCGYKAPADGNDAEAVLYRMKPGDIIPAGTGLVIRHYVTDANGGVLMFPHVSGEEAAELKPYRYVIDGDSRKESIANNPYYGIETRDYQRGGEGEVVHNYLEAINTTTPRAIYNAENDDIVDPETLLMQRGKTKVTYRNFFFGNGLKLWTTYQERVAKNIAAGMTQEDAEEAANTIGRNTMIGDNFGEGDKARGWGFFRCISDYYAISSKAFLHLPGTVENVNTNTVSMNATENDVQVQAKDMNMILIGLDETFYGQEIGGITTGIKDAQSVDQFENNSYYTLQGVKVLKPSKNGIYIHNGKKVVVR